MDGKLEYCYHCKWVREIRRWKVCPICDQPWSVVPESGDPGPGKQITISGDIFK